MSDFTKPFSGAHHKTMETTLVRTATILVCPYERPDTGNFAVNRAEMKLFADKYRDWHAEIFWQHPVLGFRETMPIGNLIWKPLRSGEYFMLYTAQEVLDML